MQNVMSLKGKMIVITGAAQGIGQAIATLAIDLVPLHRDYDSLTG